MCMCMLTRRTNILFEQETWETLAVLAQAKGSSVAELVRQAIKTVYLSEGEKMAKIKIFDSIVNLRKRAKGKINYKELIEDGRNY